jgi:hypothetical protein
MFKTQLTVLATLLLAAGLASAASDGRKTYIVQLKDEPATTYQGGVAGLPATAATGGARFTMRSRAAQAYANYLTRQQQTVAATVANAPILATYKVVFNGFSARLTDAEAISLKNNAGVVDIFEDEARVLQTVSTPRFLGLSGPTGVWSQNVAGVALQGENMVIGVVDGGIWPESPSFFDQVDASGVPVKTGGTLVYGAAPATFLGGCLSGEGFSPALHCNNKLVGAKFFNAGFLAQGLTKNWSEFYSPRDSIGGNLAHGGHGDHTASTAAGNSLVPAVVSGVAFGPASGMAPRARVAAYKVCWSYNDATATDGTGSANSCWNSDSVAAIDAAVADGVNAINYSISGAQTSVNDPVEQAFYRAALAGVFVAASAGNSGPANAVAHISPWLTTVAASTHDRALSGNVTLGSGATYTGASLNTTALPSTPMIRAEDAGVAGASATNLALCFSASANAGTALLDPAKVTGKIVVCTRGTNARVDKSAAVAEAGGVGMVLVDNGAGLVAEAHSVPTVHVTAADGALVKIYAAVAGATGSIGTFFAGTQPAPIMAGFSSRGPNMGDANVLKPDLTAPGVDIVASYAPSLTVGQRDQIVAGTLVPPPAWASIQGTSMSSPHVAGVSLLIKQAHPTWTPAAIKSALMTTATSTLNDGLAGDQNGLLPWAQGAGHINVARALDPGLVYDAVKADYVKYQCKVNPAAVSPASDCTTIGTLDQTYNLNQPAIQVGGLLGATVVKRSVTNVSAAAATYTATASVPNVTTVVTPSTLTLAPGETKSFTVTLTPTAGAAVNVWQIGALTWSDGVHSVRSPVQAKVSVPIIAPAQYLANTASGTRLFTINTGFAGRMGVSRGGLKDVTLSPAYALSPAAIGSAALKSVCLAGTDVSNVKVIPVTIPANTIAARFALRNVDTGDGTGLDDYDLMLLAPDGTALYSGNDGSNEAVQKALPAAGNYKVCVASYATGTGLGSTFKLSSWVVTTADTPANFRVLAPGAVYANGTSTVGFSWTGLDAGKRYLGAAQFQDTSGVPQAATILRVETNGGLPVTNVQDSSPKKLMN